MDDPTLMRFVARYCAQPPTLDGRLDKPVWREAQAYAFDIPLSEATNGKTFQEGAEARFAWDERCLYVGVRLVDSDIVAEGDDACRLLNLAGDVCEVFLKPEGHTCYWEIHVTPRNQQRVMFYPGRGRLGLPSCFLSSFPLHSAVACDGEVNNWRTRDREWTVELAVPVESLRDAGIPLAPGSSWRTLVSRYNYSRFLSTRGPELSSAPRLSVCDFHRHEEYAVLDLVR